MKLPPLKFVVPVIVGLFLTTGYLFIGFHGQGTVAAHVGAAEFYGDWKNSIDDSRISITVEKEELVVKNGESSSRYTLDRDGRSFLEMTSDPTRPIHRIIRRPDGDLELSILNTSGSSQQVVVYRRKR